MTLSEVSLVCAAALLATAVQCLYSGESCSPKLRPGSCQPLKDCAPLMEEIRRAPKPLPWPLSRRLNSLTCGFEGHEPLVCCPETVESTTRNEWFSIFGQPNANNNDTTHRDDTHQQNDEGNPWRETTTNSWDTSSTTETWKIADDQDLVVSTMNTQRQNRTSPDNQDDNDARPPDVRNHRNLRLLPTDCGSIEEDRIVGGNRTTLFQMPWMVLISYSSKRGIQLNCGGTLIGARYVLTAAHCVSHLGSKLTLAGVVLGEHDVRQDPDCETTEGELQCAPSARNVTIESVVVHPGYSPQNLVDDIALLRISEPADLSLANMHPICLPTTPALQRQPLLGTRGTVAGWGATDGGLQSPVLLSVDLPIVSNEDCQAYFRGTPHIYPRQLCAGGVESRDSCGGDSGGPLVYPGSVPGRGLRYVQHGIVSFGSKRCGVQGYPGIYTRVAFYMDWILDNIRA